MRLFLWFLIGLSGCAPSERLNGGGASFVYPIMLEWARVYEQTSGGVQVDYQSTGSGNGVQQMLRQTIDFGCTDVPLTAEQLELARQRGGTVLHLPLVFGAVVPVYNLPEIPDTQRLRFDGNALADIHLGRIRVWNHPDLVALNPDVSLPERAILPVVRSDPSGTTAIWSSYLVRYRGEQWNELGIKPGTLIGWPRAGNAIGQKGNEGVAGLVKRIPGGFGYVEQIYAEPNRLDAGLVRNRAGKFVAATAASVRAAVDSYRTFPDSLQLDLIDRDGGDAYPISGATYAVFYRKQPATRGKRLVDFLLWATDERNGQTSVEPLGYAPLPPRLVTLVRQRLQSEVEYRP